MISWRQGQGDVWALRISHPESASFVHFSIKGFPLFATTNAKASADMQKKERKQYGRNSIAYACSNDSSEPSAVQWRQIQATWGLNSIRLQRQRTIPTRQYATSVVEPKT
jgi:hypothetical protein